MQSVGDLQQRKRPVSSRRDQEVLPTGGGDESLEPIVFIGDPVLSNQVERGLVSAHLCEKVGDRHQPTAASVRLS